jgi:3-dehydroquinate synthase
MSLKKQKKTRQLKVPLPNKRQDIFVGSNLSSLIIEKIASENYSSFVVFCDYNVAHIYKEFLSEINVKIKPVEIILVNPTETSKSINFLTTFLEKCITVKLGRKGCLIAIGGGIVGDTAGFIASVYMRGIDMIFIPTTLMSQGDAIINKVAVSYKLLKNIIGSFYSPRFIFCDTNFLKSLPKKEIILGLSEVIKHSLIASPKFVKNLLVTIPSILNNWKDYDWTNVVYESLKIKSRLVIKDPYDKFSVQKGLSYGHTFANAFEGLSDFNFRHGEAVALGMCISGEISNTLGILKKPDLNLQNSLIASIKLPLKFPHPASIDQIIDLLKKDKISSDGRINLVLLKKIGKYEVINNVDETIIRSKLNRFLF